MEYFREYSKCSTLQSDILIVLSTNLDREVLESSPISCTAIFHLPEVKRFWVFLTASSTLDTYTTWLIWVSYVNNLRSVWDKHISIYFWLIKLSLPMMSYSAQSWQHLFMILNNSWDRWESCRDDVWSISIILSFVLSHVIVNSTPDSQLCCVYSTWKITYLSTV